MSDPQRDFLYFQPRWRGRKVVRHFVAALAIGGLALSLSYVYKKTDTPITKGWTRETVLRRASDDRRADKFVLSIQVILLNGSTTWPVPSDFGTLVSVESIGGGSSGNSSNTGANKASGGGGAYAKITSSTTPLGFGVPNISVGVGAGGTAVTGNTTSVAGGDTWWNATSALDAVTQGSGKSCAAKGASAATSGTGGVGGSSANSTGTVKFAGGNGLGGQDNSGAGGAAGPNGAGGNGTTTAGGAADNATVAGPTTSANGNSGTEFDGTHGCGTGALTLSVGTAKNGGLYGGGGTVTFAANPSGTGANGILVINYTPLTLIGQVVM